MRRRDHDIKAPDGFVLGGLRTVRSDGTILFQRGYWQAPQEWAGERVWVHEIWVEGFRAKQGGWGDHQFVEAAPPGVHIYRARAEFTAIRCERTGRPDAKSGYRNPAHKAYAARMAGSAK